MRTCDLHTHTCFSDGTDTPTQLVAEAQGIGLSAIALCDHNTVDGLPEFFRAAEDKDIEAIAGIEITCEYDGVELHMLGLYLPLDRLFMLTPTIDTIRERKEKSNADLISRLCEGGYYIDYEEIKRAYGDNINRSQIADMLVRREYCQSKNEAFSTILKEGGRFYTPPERFQAFEIIELLTDMGARAVWAHPFYSIKDASRIEKFLSEAKPHGLCGMETLYPTYTPEQTQIARELAKKYELCESGGSDYHGKGKKGIYLGTGKGSLQIPYEFAERLKG